MNALINCNCCAREPTVEFIDEPDARPIIEASAEVMQELEKPQAEPEPAPAEAEPEPAPEPVKISFSTPDGVKELLFTQAPLGMDFTKKDPQIVKRIHIAGHAAELGVQPGWVINALDDESMEGKDFECIYGALKGAASKLPAVAVANAPPPLLISFLLPDQRIQELSFTKTPLGMDFKKKEYTTVRGVVADSHAAELGVKEGWVISTIDGEDMAGKDFDTFFSKLQMGAVKAALGIDGARILPIAFRLPNSSTKKVNFTKSPLGIEIGKKEPTTVKGAAAGTQAALMGVQVGWVLTTINGENVEGKDFDYVYGKLTSLSGGLESA